MIEQTLNMLGLKARDKVTGFRGTITSVSFDLYGCVQIALTPDAKEDQTKLDHGHWFDVHRIESNEDNRVMAVPDFKAMATKGQPSTYRHGASEKPELNEEREDTQT